VDVKRVNQMVDIKNVAADVEDFQNKSEEGDTAEHHVRQIAEECADKKSHFRSMFAHLLLCSRFDPTLEGSCGFRLVKNHKRSLAYFPKFLLLPIGFGRRGRRRGGRLRRRRR
jgi:hypothetical protein